MNKPSKMFLSCFLIIFIPWVSSAQDIARYSLDLNDGQLIAPNICEFDIDMTWTNSDSIPEFMYAGAQFFLNIDSTVKNGGTLTYTKVSSDLPSNFVPRNPAVFLYLDNSTNTYRYQLRLAVNTFPGPGNGYIFPANTPLTIVRMRLTTTATQFANVPLNIQWRSALPNPYTKVFQYVNGLVNTEITNPSSHTISLPPKFFIPYNVSIKLAPEGLLTGNVLNKRDPIIVYLKNSLSPYQTLDSGSLSLDSLTMAVTLSTSIQIGNYYIVVKHVNSIETWSKPGGEPLGAGDYFYDFTTSASQAYGNNLVLKNGLYCIYSGNLNGDDVIDADDMLIMDNAVFNYAPGSSIANLNGDQIVDIDDMAICDNNARAIRVVERPMSLELFKFGTAKLNPNFQKN